LPAKSGSDGGAAIPGDADTDTVDVPHGIQHDPDQFPTDLQTA
jgi:hypothetical protein